ncbi:MAG TPA: polymer-forming cytoskeletal protein [Rhodospirillaceae bacterium]|nr:polymer-forming cytoskeletal protein [Rhodospirillaceae bacterium]
MPLSIIGPGCEITGDLFSGGEIHLAGKVIGTIRCQKLVVLKGGRLTGLMVAEQASLQGTIEGQVSGCSLDIGGTAEIKGDIFCDRLSLQRGAKCSGKINRREAAPDDNKDTPPATLMLPVPNLA